MSLLIKKAGLKARCKIIKTPGIAYLFEKEFREL